MLLLKSWKYNSRAPFIGRKLIAFIFPRFLFRLREKGSGLNWTNFNSGNWKTNDAYLAARKLILEGCDLNIPVD